MWLDWRDELLLSRAGAVTWRLLSMHLHQRGRSPVGRMVARQQTSRAPQLTWSPFGRESFLYLFYQSILVTAGSVWSQTWREGGSVWLSNDTIIIHIQLWPMWSAMGGSASTLSLVASCSSHSGFMEQYLSSVLCHFEFVLCHVCVCSLQFVSWRTHSTRGSN